MITETDPNKAKMKIKESKDNNLRILSQDHDFNRRVIEYGKFSAIIFPNTKIKTQRKIKNIECGIDRVSAKAAAKNKITILYDLSKIRNLNKMEKAIELEKLFEIKRLVKKHFVSFQFLNAKDEKAIAF